MKIAPNASDIQRHAEQLGWSVTGTRADEIAAGVKAAYDHLARASSRLDFDADTLSLFAARTACKDTSASPPSATARKAANVDASSQI